MARPERFSEREILDSALEQGGESGFERLSASRVAQRLGAPSGSIYHRYPSRDALMAALWLRTVERFQAGYLEALASADPPLERACSAARHVLRWSRRHAHAAQLLLRYRCEDLLAGEMPPAIAKRAAKVNQPAIEAVTALARELAASAEGDPGETIDRVRFACVTVPMGAAREALVQGRAPSVATEAYVDETVRALLGGERR